ncbi:MAG: histidine kinase dimerization/phosphoacceptor domain-containing protein, partial [Solirubrobacterales bacterium]|nr:histidine kinase dimerization/phosphoacceptor domain-containing protein [Solirubrobacterales bacterium]
MPFAIGLGIIRGRVFAMSALEHMVGRLGDQPGLRELEQTVAREFGDPELQLLVWRSPARRFVDISGAPVELPVDDPRRTVTRLRRNDEPLAALVHDPVLSDDVLDAIGSAVRLALDNARLQTDLAASIRELEASRERLASAADEERRRIEQDLHDGAQQGLIALRIKLQLLHELATERAEALLPAIADAGKSVDTTLQA